MKNTGLVPNRNTYNILVHGYCRLKWMKEAAEVVMEQIIMDLAIELHIMLAEYIFYESPEVFYPGEDDLAIARPVLRPTLLQFRTAQIATKAQSMSNTLTPSPQATNLKFHKPEEKGACVYDTNRPLKNEGATGCGVKVTESGRRMAEGVCCE
ncbi:Pentatricopeptide repeat-containing protein [Spatholobus suberectus]|nr:Pentatricopeptide repeat-containing protein [Spatholobus suberectus]